MTRHIIRLVPLALAIAALPSSTAVAAATHLRKPLTPTAKAPGARGIANLVVRGSRGRFGVGARRLRGDARFEVVVDTVRVGTLTTGPTGRGKARFSTPAHASDQLLGADPSGKLVEVRDEDGDDVLETEMPGDSPPGNTRCCVGDAGAECESESPDECAVAGGIDLGEGSCLPNPCSTSSDEAIRCCQPDHDEDGPECEPSTADECSADGGTNLGAGTCDPNPCRATSPPEGEVACCVPDGTDDAGDGEDQTEMECEMTTAEGCAALGGTASGAASCDADPCVAPTTTASGTPMIGG
jgi:hypothetical protein